MTPVTLVRSDVSNLQHAMSVYFRNQEDILEDYKNAEQPEAYKKIIKDKTQQIQSIRSTMNKIIRMTDFTKKRLDDPEVESTYDVEFVVTYKETREEVDQRMSREIRTGREF